MSKVPFRRFITTFLLFGNDIAYTQKKLREFRYNVTDEEISRIFEEIKNTLPEKYREMVVHKQLLDLNDPSQVEWLNHFGIFEFYDFIVRQKDNLKEPPDYFKWIMDCMWAHGYKDVMSLINIFIFNGSDNTEISKVISFKYKKKISENALELYRRIFWDVEDINAKEALYYCTPFRSNALIIRNLRGGTEFEAVDNGADSIGNIDDQHSDGSDVPFVFHDLNYIKWKIGYREGISVPTSRDFLSRVKEDSFFKYYETMNMVRSVETEEEEGENEKIGAFNSTKKKYRNVEEQRANMVKKWIDIHIKANSAMPNEPLKKEDFFEKMKQLTLEFDEGDGEDKIAHIDDIPDMLDQIKGDMSDV